METSEGTRMDPAVASLLGALIGGLAGIAGGWFSGANQARLEREKWLRARSDEFAKELRTAVRELTTELADACHAMDWLCWLAKYGPDRLTSERIDHYDDTMHRLFPGLFGLHAVIAGMDQEVHRKLLPLVDGVVDLDARVGQASLRFVPGSPDSAAPLAELHSDSLALTYSLHEIVAAAVSPYAVLPNRSVTDSDPS
jgi:hypothetical protein